MAAGQSFAGFRGGNRIQDAAVQLSSGPMYDRAKEHLVPADLAIIRLRRLLAELGPAARGGTRSGRPRRGLRLRADHGRLADHRRQPGVAGPRPRAPGQRLMRVWIDQDYCTGSGLCELIEPRVFAIGDDGLARVRAAEVPPGCEDEVRDAAESCPGGCIRLEPRPLSRTYAWFPPAHVKPADRGKRRNRGYRERNSAGPRAGAVAAVRRRDRGHHLGGDQPGLPGRGTRACPADLRRGRASLRAGGAHRPAPGHRIRLPGGAGRGGALAGTNDPFGPSVLRTLDPNGPQRLAFGSCRVAELPAPRRRRRCTSRNTAPWPWPGLASHEPRDSWPVHMLLIGDQVYADETGRPRGEVNERRRDPAVPPGDQVADFEEYCALYREAWSLPGVRWLLSVIPSIMIFDDHDVHDRLEHLGGLAAQVPGPAVVAGAHRRRVHELLGVPAPGQSRPGRARPGRAVAAGARGAGTPRRCCARWRGGRTRRTAPSGGACGATWAPCGWW